MEDENLPTPGVSISRRFCGEAWLKYLLYVYAFPKAFVNFRPRAGMGLDGGCVDGFNPPAVDMGQVEGEGAAAEVGAVIVGRVPFAAEVAAVSGDIASVGDGGSGGITRSAAEDDGMLNLPETVPSLYSFRVSIRAPVLLLVPETVPL